MIRSELEIVEEIVAPYKRHIEELQAEVERLTGEARYYIAKSDDLDKNYDELQAQVEVMREALDYMHREKCDYMLLNNLGNPVHETSYTLAVKALSTTPPQALKQFAEKVRNQALEDAAVACDCMADGWENNPGNNPMAGYIASSNCANAIREMKKEMK